MKDQKIFERNGLQVKVVSERRRIPVRIRSEAEGVLKALEKENQVSDNDEGMIFKQHLSVNGGYPAKYSSIMRDQGGGALHGISVFMLCKLLQRQVGYESLEGITVEPTEDWTSLKADVRVEGSTVLGEAGFVQPVNGFSSPNTYAIMDRFVSLASDYYNSTGNKPLNMKMYHIPFRHKGRRKSLYQLEDSDIPRSYNYLTAKLFKEQT